MSLARLIDAAARLGASDLHIEAGLPPTVRVRGSLTELPDAALLPAEVEGMAREIVPEDEWERFVERRSADRAATLAGVRCRVNLLHSSRGIGLAVRLLPADDVTLTTLNLHPELARLVEPEHGLVLVSGPTGCGKSATLAALIHEINVHRSRHIVTLEQPIEYDLRPKRSFVRQREVGRDTPSFAQGLLDAMREDIDVLMVGEMRDRETMRLTLDACETGHLVLATMHSSTTLEALQRIVSAFPAAEQPSVCAQLADVLVGVVAQRLQWRDDLQLRVPECEVLMGTTPVRSVLRQGALFKLNSAIETGRRSGMWTWERYRGWLDEREDWWVPTPGRPADAGVTAESVPTGADAADDADDGDDDVIVIQPDERSLSEIVSDLDEQSGRRRPR